MALSQQYTFGFIDQLVRINFPQVIDNFMIGGLNPDIVTPFFQNSVDGETWNDQVAPPRINVFSSIAYGEGVWMAGPYRSTDLQSWSQVDVDIRAVAYGKPNTAATHGLFIGCNNRPNQVFVSSDLGKTFTTVNLGFDLDDNSIGMDALYISFAGGAFYVGSTANVSGSPTSGSPYPILWRSTDGITWTPIPMFTGQPPFVYFDGSYIGGVVYNVAGDNKKLVAIGEMTQNPVTSLQPWLVSSTSGNGSSWGNDEIYSGVGLKGFAGNPCVTFGQNKFIVSAGKYAHLTDFATSTCVILSSPDGNGLIPVFDFTPDGTFVNCGFNGVAYSRSAKNFVAIGNMVSNEVGETKGLLFSSPDGETWTKRTTGFDTGSLSDVKQIINIGVGKLPKATS